MVGYEEDFLGKLSDTWMLHESEELYIYQNSAQNLAEIITKLEENVNVGFENLFKKISGMGEHVYQITEPSRNIRLMESVFSIHAL